MKKCYRRYDMCNSFFMLVLFLLGLYIIYLVLFENLKLGLVLMIVGFAIYITNNILMNIWDFSTYFTNSLENIVVLVTFGIPVLIFGVKFYRTSEVFLLGILFYSVCLLFALARNNILDIKNSMGFPVVLNGVFFPLVYYLYSYFWNNEGNIIFVFYFVVFGILSISSYNFLSSSLGLVGGDISVVGESIDLNLNKDARKTGKIVDEIEADKIDDAVAVEEKSFLKKVEKKEEIDDVVEVTVKEDSFLKKVEKKEKIDEIFGNKRII